VEGPRLRVNFELTRSWNLGTTNLELVKSSLMNLGLSEMIFIFVLALIIFGPKKMPEIGRQIGRALAEFKRASNEFKAQIETEINNLEVETNPHSTAPVEAPQGTVASGDGLAHVEAVPEPEIMPPAKAPDA